jgi:hypothetical protein
MIEGNWAPITRYFGEGTTWHSDVLALVQPKFTSVQPLAGRRLQIQGAGYPGGSYSLQSSSNLSGWQFFTNQLAATNSQISFVVSNSSASRSRFYRLSTP